MQNLKDGRSAEVLITNNERMKDQLKGKNRMPLLAMTIAGWLFLLIALMHLAHIVFDLEFKVAGYAVPLWMNVTGTIVFLLLSLLLFWSTRAFRRVHL